MNLLPVLVILSGISAILADSYRPCPELSRELRLPCKCALGPIEAALDGNPAISVDCDRVVFQGDFPALPYGAPIVSYRQRHAGYQSLPTQAFAQSGLPLRSLDFSGNSLRRLTDRLLNGLQDSLLELRLADNLLGDTLNPIFSSSEFHGLRHLQLMDLSGNGIKSIEEGILEGCERLQELILDRNSLSSIPGASLNGPKSLKILSVKENRITIVKSGAFQAQRNLDIIDLSHNLIGNIEGAAFSHLDKLKSLKLGRNRLTKFNSDVFQGADNLQQLDLSENFITEFPSVALKAFANLRYLNLSSNLIQSLDNNDLTHLVNLYHLDLSRNNIANIVPGTFLGLKQLRRLDISVNSLRTIEDDAFEGLDNLEHLSLKDNTIFLIPASALGRLPKLQSLHLDYNRVAALSGDILRSIAERVTNLVISKNLIRELPPATFQYFQQLEHLDLTRNSLMTLNSDTFEGLENSLLSLKVAQNAITNLAGPPLALVKLMSLDLSDNQLADLARNSFTLLPNLRKLNLSRNSRLSSIPPTLLHKLDNLEVIDLSHINLKSLSTDLLAKNLLIKEIYLNDNDLSEITDGTFVNLRNLTRIDLSDNSIANIRPGAFVNAMNLKELYLQGNQLAVFRGEFFNTGTGLEILDVSNNLLNYVYPSSFRIHPRLKKIVAGNNKFNFFLPEVIATLQYLEFVDLSGNMLEAVEELEFARLPKLRCLLLGNNKIESVHEMSFHNSTQLQIIDLKNNKLDRLGERTFEGLVRIEMLNLEGNRLSDLPETIFERSRLQMLENINLARNNFEVAPLKSLQRQYFFVNSVDLSHNKLKEIPADDSTMVNIKKLDLSFNPLSEKAIENILGEPKTVRTLNLAGVGIVNVARLETPFLSFLNLSHNNISDLSAKVFERTTLLETLDISNNNVKDLTNFPKIWEVLRNLQVLNMSFNPIAMISNNDFEGLKSLRYFSLRDLEQCSRIEKNSFKSTPNLSVLDAYNFPKLGYLDVPGLLLNLPSLEKVNIEIKDAAIGNDQLLSILHPRLRELGLHGSRLRSISSTALSGLKGSSVMIRLMNTSLTSISPALFFPVPPSSKITLDVSGSQLSTLSPQLINTLSERKENLHIVGLETNPIICDCSAKALRKWANNKMTSIKCSAPEHLMNKYLVEVGDDELSCDSRRATTQTPSTFGASKTTRLLPKTTEPEIIWSVASTEKIKPKTAQKPAIGQSSINNDDTLIIGIVGGVVAFIAILIIIICIIRLRMTNTQYRGGPLANGNPVMGPVIGPASSCATCSVKGAPPVYVPSYGGYSSTLPHKLSATPNARPAYSTMGRMPPYSQPYFIATYPSDEKIYR
ncbi:PREDICTED: chaoptin [Nicrophorus vespilloides]|uniref:Chaoptin n=1 Tax=Nicrophorus vespilloides TaxID=110193 RepID=A0ABM1NGF4_NICVS|nr:PREDICTED: chaoptin [Nicrophorus vespilloides]